MSVFTFILLYRLRKAIATLRLASYCPTIYLSSSATICFGVWYLESSIKMNLRPTLIELRLLYNKFQGCFYFFLQQGQLQHFIDGIHIVERESLHIMFLDFQNITSVFRTHDNLLDTASFSRQNFLLDPSHR